MRLLKTHSHTSDRLAMEPGTREEKQLKETQTLQQGKSQPSKTFRVPPVWRGGGRKGSKSCRMPPVWRGGAGKALRQTNHRKGAMARRALVDMERNTDTNRREKSCEKPPVGHRQGGGIAHDKDPEPVFWPNPGERVGRTKPGETATQRQSRPRGPQPKSVGGGDHHHRRGGDSASGAGVAEGAAEGATLVQQPGQ